MVYNWPHFNEPANKHNEDHLFCKNFNRLEFLLSFGYESIKEEMVVTAAFESWSFQKLSWATWMTSPASSPINFKQIYSVGKLDLLDTPQNPTGHLWIYTGSSTTLVYILCIPQDLLNSFKSFFLLILEIWGKSLTPLWNTSLALEVMPAVSLPRMELSRELKNLQTCLLPLSKSYGLGSGFPAPTLCCMDRTFNSLQWVRWQKTGTASEQAFTRCM